MLLTYIGFLFGGFVAALASAAAAVLIKRQTQYIRQRTRGSVALNRYRQGQGAKNELFVFQRFSEITLRVSKKYHMPQPLIITNDDAADYAAIGYSILSPIPILLFGKEVEDFTDRELEGIVGHELAHFKRRYRIYAVLHYFLYAWVRFLCEECAADAVAAEHVGKETILASLKRVRAQIERENDVQAVEELDKRIRLIRAMPSSG
ncbi:MAG: hypothetical protein Q7S09_00210 [bacterium]|nr:hypothetical protein [bacterium]